MPSIFCVAEKRALWYNNHIALSAGFKLCGTLTLDGGGTAFFVSRKAILPLTNVPEALALWLML